MSTPKTNLYLERYAWDRQEFPAYIPPKDLDIIVVIPAYNERHLNKAVRSINQCDDKKNVLVMVIFNEAEDENTSVRKVNEQAFEELQKESYDIPILTKIIPLPPKKAGVGLARKIGMDEAVRIFESLNKDGIIVCCDADCTCDTNYFQAIREFYQNKTKNLGLVYYEHILQGDNNEAIVNYELYLRYYVDGLRWAGFPFAFQTLGSCITVRSKAYQKQGGMNTRKAGEDFYFIHKMTPLGGIGEINSTCVRPSDRISDRVPFGTGHAVNKYLQQESEDYEVYNPRIFAEVKYFLESLPFLYQCNAIEEMGYTEKLMDFFNQQGFQDDFSKMKKNASNAASFVRRFYGWFDGFRVLKMVHHLRDNHYPNIDIVPALGWLNHEYLHLKHFGGTKEEKLLALREFDQENTFYRK